MHGIILEGRLEFVLCEIQVAQVEKGGRGMEWRGPSRSTCAFEARRANGMLPLRTRNMELAGIAANHLDTLRVEVAVSSIFFFFFFFLLFLSPPRVLPRVACWVKRSRARSAS